MTQILNPQQAIKSFHARLENELSYFYVKIINKDGSVTISRVDNSYFLENDIWNLDYIGTIENFREPVSKYTRTFKNLHFSISNPTVKTELKYLFFSKLFREEWTIHTCMSTIYDCKNLMLFLNEEYPNIRSILELDLDVVNQEWHAWLMKHGKRLTQTINRRHNYKTEIHSTNIATFFKKVYTTLKDITDDREEWDKESWDIRKLNNIYGIKYNKSQNNYFINFDKVHNPHFRNGLKKYFKHRLLGKQNFSGGTAVNYMTYIPNFLNVISKLEPKWLDLKRLRRVHILKFMEWLHIHSKNTIKHKANNPNGYIRQSLHIVQKFLIDIQNYQYDMAPETDIRILIFPEDKPREKKKAYDQVDYIPDFVLEQLFREIDYLHKEIQPIVWIAFKTGLRISDVLTLKHDCLVKLNGKYQIVTDIQKTYVNGHSIPIDDELAAIIAVFIDNSCKRSNEENNPEKFIFVRYRGPRKGKPYSQEWIRQNLNALSIEREILGEDGKTFHFKTHQFRHTYAVKLLNNGTDILTVKELLAHASPEMTMRYAKLLDTTKRKAFEEAVKQGIFSFDMNGEVNEIKPNEDIPSDVLEMLWREQKLTAVDNPYGTCHARINGNCPYSEEPPCLTCNGGSPCKDLAIGFSNLDLQKYELLVKTATKTIEALQLRGRSEIAEKNKRNLDRFQSILNTLEGGNIIFGRLERIKRKKVLNND